MDSFKVAIVGGSVAGLTLALHLEQLGIDWILIERQDHIAPRLGASFTLNANGLSGLCQLGCLDEAERLSHPMNRVTVRNGGGTILKSIEPRELIFAKLKYDVRFLERQTLVDLLHRSIKKKDKIVTGQLVNRIDHIADTKVALHTREGKSFTANIVVGADGIRSRVRQEMWRTAQEDGSSLHGIDPAQNIHTEFACIFGLSDPVNDLVAGEAIQVHERGTILGINIGPQNTPYWFLIFALPKQYSGLDFPQFTDEDETKLVMREGHRLIKPGTTFLDLYKNKKMSYMTPLPHGCFERWHYRRIMCIGDAAHKLNPLTGQGGCMAIETALSLGDNIQAALMKDKSSSPSDDEIETAFQKVRATRIDRVTTVMNESVMAARFGSWSNIIFQFLDNYVLWLVPAKFLMDNLTVSAVGGYESTTLPPPKIKVPS